MRCCFRPVSNAVLTAPGGRSCCQRACSVQVCCGAPCAPAANGLRRNTRGGRSASTRAECRNCGGQPPCLGNCWATPPVRGGQRSLCSACSVLVSFSFLLFLLRLLNIFYLDPQVFLLLLFRSSFPSSIAVRSEQLAAYWD